MKLSIKNFIKNTRSGYILLWTALYVGILAGTATIATAMYHKYETNHLPSGNIELAVNNTRYQLGETVEFTITNHFPVPIYVTNQCPNEPLNVYRWSEGTWIQLHAVARTDAECYQEERNVAIPSENMRSYNFNDWPDLFSYPGVYRVAVNIDHYDDIPFQDFVIMEPAQIIEVLDPPQIKYVQEESQPAVEVAAPESDPIIEVLSKVVDIYNQLDIEPEEEPQEREREDDEDEKEDDD